jgi:hypothetical protein
VCDEEETYATRIMCHTLPGKLIARLYVAEEYGHELLACWTRFSFHVDIIKYVFIPSHKVHVIRLRYVTFNPFRQVTISHAR